ncbi:replication protein A 70 kDa DNA-binding subunit C-like protein, partial [Tanacetum coccineum]
MGVLEGVTWLHPVVKHDQKQTPQSKIKWAYAVDVGPAVQAKRRAVLKDIFNNPFNGSSVKVVNGVKAQIKKYTAKKNERVAPSIRVEPQMQKRIKKLHNSNLHNSSYSKMSMFAASNQTELLLKQLELGATGTIVVMICKMWDTNTSIGRYLTIDFIISDREGNLMHCTTRGNIAHNFLRLKERTIYSVKNFNVQPNKDEFCVMRFADFMLEFDSNTIVRKAFVKTDGFIRYPFQLVKIDVLEPTNNKYLI